MALLDLQAMDSARHGDDARCPGSELSLLLCDSAVSLSLC